MGFSRILLKVSAFVLVVEYVRAQKIYDVNHNDGSHLRKIPRKFEIRGENALTEFGKYIHDIQNLIAEKNMTVMYRVKVDVTDNHKQTKNKKLHKKTKSKKYNIPLKKQSMKLSNFEILLRKLAEEKGQNMYQEEKSSTKEENVETTTKQIHLKYKPYRRLRTNSSQTVKPVRTKIITLTV